MKKNLLTIIRISRPLFWMYLAGPYLIGVTSASSSLSVFSTLQFWYPFLYFLIPANIILYGVNDISDQDTDLFNDKKQDKEVLYSKSISSVYSMGIKISIVLALPLFYLFPSFEERSMLFLFFFLSVFYSLSPLRFKKRAGIDSLSNILYILPGILGYISFTPSFPPLFTVISAASWAIAMHLFSAIPDIEADKKAKLSTTAIMLGKKPSLIVCSVLWSISVVPLAATNLVFLLFSLYPLLPILLLTSDEKTIKHVYWYFPFINLFYGALLWILISWRFL